LLFGRWLCWAYWSIAIFSCLLSCVSSYAETLSRYGKISQPMGDAERGSFASKLANMTVSKAWFLHFYVIAVVWSAVLIVLGLFEVDIVGRIIGDVVGSSGLQLCSHEKRVLGSHTVIMLLVFFIHACRRLYESICITKFSSKARMHIAGYIVGATFYLAVGWSIVVEPRIMSSRMSVLQTVIAGILFVVGSYQQHKSHKILSDLRQGKTRAYSIPRMGWFEYVSSPHYLSEILIYASILVQNTQSISLLLMFTFVVFNLSITAARTHAWYKQKFDDYPKERTRMIPFLF